MSKVKFFMASSHGVLEQLVNDFIVNKMVTTISYTVQDLGHTAVHCCCVLYNSIG